MTAEYRAGRAGALTVLAVGLVLGAATPAAAHSDLESAAPADGAVLRAGPSAVTLVFNEAVQERFVRVAVTGPRDRAVASGSPRVTGARVEQPVTVTDAGAYVVAYRVVSADGHTVQGQLRFRFVAPAAAATPSPSPSRSAPAGAASTPPQSTGPTSTAPTAPATTAAPAATGDGNSGLGFLIVLGPMLAGLLAVGIVLARRPRGSAPAPADDGG